MFIKFTNSSSGKHCKECKKEDYHNSPRVNATSVHYCREVVLENMYSTRPLIDCKRATIVLNEFDKTSPEYGQNILNLIKAVIYTQTDLNLTPRLARTANFGISLDGKVIDYIALLSVIMYFMKVGMSFSIDPFKSDFTSKEQTHKDLYDYMGLLIDYAKNKSIKNYFYSKNEIYSELDRIRCSLAELFNKGGIQKLTKEYDKSHLIEECENCGRPLYFGVLQFTKDIS